MFRNIVPGIILFMICQKGYAQHVSLPLAGLPGATYIMHTVKATDNLMSLAVLYRQSPNAIAAFNNVRLSTNLSDLLSLKIPVNKNNYTLVANTTAGSELLVPLYVDFNGKQGVTAWTATWSVTDSIFKKLNPDLPKKIAPNTPVVIGFLRVNRNSPLLGQFLTSANKNLIAVSSRDTIEHHRMEVEKWPMGKDKKKVVAKESKDELRPVKTPEAPASTAIENTKKKRIEPEGAPGKKVKATDTKQAEINVTAIPSSPAASSKNDVAKPIDTVQSSTQKQAAINTAKMGSDELFTLARKTAFDKKDYATALHYCNIALTKSPLYTDVMVFKGRLYTWTDQRDSAKQSFQQALSIAPNNLEASIGYADVLYWNDENDTALYVINKGLAINGTSTQLLLRKAKVLNVLNRPVEANTVLVRLLKIDPANTAARALNARLNNLSAKNRLGVSYDYFYFDKQFNDPWHLLSIDYSRQTKVGSIGGHINYANRFTRSGIQYEVDGYPRLLPHVYAYVSFAYSDDVGVFPKYRSAVSIYASLPASYEAELGYRHLYFSDATLIYTGAVGKYYKSWYFLARTYINPSNTSLSHSYNLTSRYYYGGANDFAGITIGTGISPDESNSNVLLNKPEKLSTIRASANYRHAFKDKYILALSAGWVNQEFRPKVKGNQIDGGFSIQVRF